MPTEILSFLMIKAKAVAAASMSECGYLELSEGAKQAIFCQNSWWSYIERHWTWHGVLYTKQILIISTFMELNGFMIGPEINKLFKIKVGTLIAEHPVVLAKFKFSEGAILWRRPRWAVWNFHEDIREEGCHPRRQRIQLPLRHRDRGARVSPEMSAINLD